MAISCLCLREEGGQGGKKVPEWERAAFYSTAVDDAASHRAVLTAAAGSVSSSRACGLKLHGLEPPVARAPPSHHLGQCHTQLLLSFIKSLVFKEP